MSTSSEPNAGDDGGGGRSSGMSVSTTSIAPKPSLDAIEMADVTLEAGGEVFQAHMFVLTARSPVFMEQLSGPMMQENVVAHIRIDDMEARVLKELLHFIYTDRHPEMMIDEDDDELEMAKKLLVAADRFGMEKLKVFCANMLRQRHIDAGTVAAILALAEQHGCHGLKEACFKFLKSFGNLMEFVASDGFEHLARSCPALLKELLLASLDA